MTILKQQLKILRFISKNQPVMASVLYSRYGYDEVTGLLRGGYIICPEDPRRQDDEGYVIGAFLPTSLFSLTDKGQAEVESREWFDFQYVVSMILVPVAVGVISAIVTNLIMSVL